MKKTAIVTALSLLFAFLLSISAGYTLAATTDFAANADITVSGVSSNVGNVNMIIFNGSKAESWAVDGNGNFSVTNPDATSLFTVGSSDGSIKILTIVQNGTQILCVPNNTPGTTAATLPSSAGTYYVVPSGTSACGGSVAIINTPSSSSSSPAAPSTSPAPSASPASTPSTSPAPFLPTTPSNLAPTTPAVKARVDLGIVLDEATAIARGTRDSILSRFNEQRNIKIETQINKIVVKSVAGFNSLKQTAKERINAFAVYGTPTTEALGVGERVGVIKSFKNAFGKLPQTEKDWQDMLKISNTQRPGQVSKSKEQRAASSFKSIYGRQPNLTKPADDLAVAFMAYGLRTSDRNTAKEKAAIKKYRAVFGRSPATDTAWDAVRAIAYSGAKQ